MDWADPSIVSSPHPTHTLVTLPADVLHLVLAELYDLPEEHGRYDFEVCKGRSLLPLSESCWYLRGQTLPWIFHEVYNWSRPDGAIWPETLLSLFRTVHIRDRSIRNAQNILLSSGLYDALPMMRSLTNVTLRLDQPVPAELLHALSQAQLTSLEIHQARLDGTADYSSLPFSILDSLSICIAGFGFEGVVRSEDIDRVRETKNVATLLKNFSHSLCMFQISGDLLSPDFLSLRWPKLRKFTITEHTPTLFIPVPDLVSQMPALRELSVLYCPDSSRDWNAGEGCPPFRLGTATGGLLTSCCPHLVSVTLSNLESGDPIFAQLPHGLQSLHLLAKGDGSFPVFGKPRQLLEAALTHTTALTALENISHLADLTELSLTLETFVTAVLIHCVASFFPRLRFLELGNSTYLYGALSPPDFRDPTILEALQCFPLLTDLRISLNFPDLVMNQHVPHRRAARWLLDGLPNLRTVAFSWEQDGQKHGSDLLVWRVWDRSVFQCPPSPSLPTREPTPWIIEPAIPLPDDYD
ncbi:hypothetical protein GGX14DRAFT_605587 [Mycena pura]|uniref:F-box domain-containing protein n=1 Tax=Mycena pura TaxID=153505 RepID=A0AAD6YED5_9AGAR|nr:hypothetical protein GGX14DRAFT_605587 [Mycena pura]